MVAAGVSVPAQSALTADPKAVQLLQPASTQAAVGTGEAPAGCARVAEVDAAVLLVMIRDIMAGMSSLGSFVEGGGRTIDVMYHELGVTSARVHVVMVKVVIGAHGH